MAYAKGVSDIDRVLSEFGQRDERQKQTPESVIKKYQKALIGGKEVDKIADALYNANPLYMSELEMAIYIKDRTLSAKANEVDSNAIVYEAYKFLEELAKAHDNPGLGSENLEGAPGIIYHRGNNGCRLFVANYGEILCVVGLADGTGTKKNEQAVIDRLRNIGSDIQGEFVSQLKGLKENDLKFLEELRKQKEVVNI